VTNFRGSNIHTFGLAVIAAIFLGISGPVCVYAQVSGAVLSGSISDETGASISNSTVSIKNTVTAVTRVVTTDSAGFYSAPNLLPGTYEVTFSATGFATMVASNLLLAVGETRILNQILRVGSVSGRVEVAATAATVQLGSSTLSAEVGSTTVRELCSAPR